MRTPTTLTTLILLVVFSGPAPGLTPVVPQAVPDFGVKVGDMAPDFALPDQNGNVVKVSAFRGANNVALIFIACARTTYMLDDYQSNLPSFYQTGTQPIAIRSCNAPSATLAGQEKLSFPIVTDVGSAVSEAYRMYLPNVEPAGVPPSVPRSALGHGVTTGGTVVVDRNGRIAYVDTGGWRAAKALDACRGLAAGFSPVPSTMPIFFIPPPDNPPTEVQCWEWFNGKLNPVSCPIGDPAVVGFKPGCWVTVRGTRSGHPGYFFVGRCLEPTTASTNQGSKIFQTAAQDESQTAQSEIAKIRGGRYAPMPIPQAAAAIAGGGTSMLVANNTQYELTVYLSGPASRVIAVAPNSTQTVTIGAGHYEVAARVSNASVVPFYGAEDYAPDTQYSEKFYIESRVP